MIGLSPPSASHPKIFQHQLVRPSAPRYRGFGLLTDRSPGFGSAPRHSTRSSHSLSLRLRHWLNLAARDDSQAHYAKGMRSPTGGSHSLGAHDFRVFSLPSKGFFSPFPHGTGALSVGGQYLALWNGLHGFGRGFTCPALLGMRPRNLETPRTGLSPSAAGLSRPLRSNLVPIVPSRNPGRQACRFGLLRVRSPLLAESLLISSPRGTEMFHFPRSRLPPLWIRGGMVRHDPHRIAPFGDPWINVRLQLPMDYRGLPRPSSPAVA